MKILDLEFRKFKKAEEIEKAVKKIGKQINRDYADRDPLFLVILNGAFIFAADLFRELNIPAEVSFIKLSSYNRISSSGRITELIGLNNTVFKRNIIILEDIIDTGLTLQYTLGLLEELGAASVEVVSLFLKPESFNKKIDIRYVGFEIPGEFIVGYGMDYQGFGRNLKHVYTIK